MSDCTSVRNGAITSDERIRNVLRRAIRKAYDTREFTRETLHQQSGVSICQIDQIVTRDLSKHRRVAAEDALCLAYTLGEEAVAAVVGCIHYTAQRAEEAGQQSPGVLVAVLVSEVSTLAKAAADGRFDYTEKPACQQAADTIIATVLPLSSAGNDA